MSHQDEFEHSRTWIGIHGLDDLSTLVVDHPVGIDLRVSVRIQNHSLERKSNPGFKYGKNRVADGCLAKCHLNLDMRLLVYYFTNSSSAGGYKC